MEAGRHVLAAVAAGVLVAAGHGGLLGPLAAQEAPVRDLEPPALEAALGRVLEPISRATVHIDTGRMQGSGTLVSPDGAVLTAAHVVGRSRGCRVTLSDGRVFRGRVLGANGAGDLALVKIDAGGLPAAPLGDSSSLRHAQWVIGAGHAVAAFYDPAPSLGLGLVRDLHHFVEAGVSTRLFDTVMSDVPMAPGASGGGLFDLQGRLVGLVNAVSRNEWRTYSVRVEEFLRDRERLEAGERFDRRARRGRSRHGPKGLSRSRRRYFASHFGEALEILEARQVTLEVGEERLGGTLVDERGHVLTVSGPFEEVALDGEVAARLHDGRRLTARLAGRDETLGLALLRLPAEAGPYPAFDISAGAPLRPGRLVVCRSRHRTAGGMVVAPERWPPVELTSQPGHERFLTGVVQVDLRLHRSALGRPVVDRQGRLVGLVIQHRLKRTRGRRITGAFGALLHGSSELAESYELLAAGRGRAPRKPGYLGVMLDELTEEEKAALGVSSGVRVVRIPRRGPSPAGAAGLRRDDVILAVGGDPVHTHGAVLARVASRTAGQKVPLRIHREGRELTLIVILGTRDLP